MKKYLKSISFFLLAIIIASNVLVFAPKKAEALFPVHDTLNYILQGLKYAAQHVSLLSTGLPGSGAAVSNAVSAAQTGCIISKRAYEISNTADNLVGLNVIAGDAGQIAKLSTKIGVLSAIANCYDVVLEASRVAAKAGTLVGGQQAITSLGFTMAELNAVVISYRTRIDRLVELRDEAVKRMWEGVAYRMLATVQQQVTTRLINKLIAKYKIGNYLKYADAVATQIYTANYVNKNFPEKADQLIIRSFLTSDINQYEIMPYITNKANENLGFLPQDLAFADPNYYAKMALAGTGSANPYYLRSVYEAKAGATRAEAEIMAKQEIAQGQGFIPARNCNGVIAQQNARLDIERQKIAKDLAIKRTAFNKLQSQQLLEENSVSPRDLSTAATELAKANSALGNVGRNVDVFAQVCADIQNPAAAISNFTNSYLASALNQVNAPRPGNLPFFANFVETVGTGFLMNLVVGGSANGGLSKDLLTDAGFQAANITANEILEGITEAKTLKDADKLATSQNVIFSAAQDSVPGQFIVTWDVSAIQGVKSISINGPQYIFNSPNLSGRTIIKTNGGVSITLRALDTLNNSLVTSTYNIPVNQTPSVNITPGANLNDAANVVNSAENNLQQNGSIPPPGVCSGNYISRTACITETNDIAYCNSICGQVNGAFTNEPSFTIRGGELKIR